MRTMLRLRTGGDIGVGCVRDLLSPGSGYWFPEFVGSTVAAWGADHIVGQVTSMSSAIVAIRIAMRRRTG